MEVVVGGETQRCKSALLVGAMGLCGTSRGGERWRRRGCAFEGEQCAVELPMECASLI